MAHIIVDNVQDGAKWTTSFDFINGSTQGGRRQIIVGGLSHTGEMEQLHEALSTPGVPQDGESAGIGFSVVTGREATAIGNDKVQIDITYAPPDLGGGGGGGGDATGWQVEMGFNTVSVTNSKDYDNVPITVYYMPPQKDANGAPINTSDGWTMDSKRRKENIVKVNVLKAQRAIRARKVVDWDINQALDFQDLLEDTVNENAFLGGDLRTWLCTNVSFAWNGDKVTSVNLSLQHLKLGWDPVVLWHDENSIIPPYIDLSPTNNPNDFSSFNGGRRSRQYGTYDYNQLHLFG